MNRTALYFLLGGLLLSMKGKGSTKGNNTTTAKKNVLFGRISSGYGERTDPLTGEKRFHNGIDISTPEGTPIEALDSGKVKKVGKDSTNGNYMLITLKDGFTLGFAHLSKINIKQNKSFSKGKILALSGNTGRSTAPHVHFTVRDQTGTTVNPNKYLDKYR